MNMQGQCLPVRRTTLRVLGPKMEAENCVRAYRSDPEGITIQIRMAGRYVTTWMPFADARELAEHILKEANRD